MDPLWKIAIRNVLRHRKRTLITAIVMMVGIGTYITYDAVLAGMDRLSIDTMVQYSSAWLKVRTPAYVANETGTPLDHGIPAPGDSAAAMRKAWPAIRAVTPRTLFLGQASNYEDAEPVVSAAIDPATDALVFDVAANVAQGSWFGAPGTARHEVVVSADLAGDLGLKVGDALLLSARTAYENDNADEFTIIGITDSGLSLAAKLYMDYSDARVFLGEGLPVTELDASAPRAPNLEAELAGAAKAASAVQAALPGLKVQPVGDFAKDYLALRDSKSKGSFMIVLIILLIAAVGIVNTILMSVYSRVREIGVLRAFGMPPKDIKRLFVREGLILGLIGSTSGLVLGGGLVAWLSTSGLRLATLFKGMDLGAFPTNGTLYAEWKPESFAIGLAFGLLSSWLAARSPAKRAARLEPTDALRFV